MSKSLCSNNETIRENIGQIDYNAVPKLKKKKITPRRIIYINLYFDI